jgi:flagellar hook-associated protein 3 FlgL
MRITQSMITRNTLSNVNLHRSNLVNIQERIATQKKVQKASDDPVSFSRITRFSEAMEQNEQFLKNILFSSTWIDTTTESIDQLRDYAIQAKDIATQGADASSDADVRNNLAQTLRGMYEEALSLVNSKYLDKSLFAGTNTNNNLPFEEQAGAVVYSGNDDPIIRKVSQNTTITINVTGQDIMDTNFFDSILTLITALEADDVPNIQTSIDAMGNAADDLLNLSSNAASITKNLEIIENRLINTNEKLAAYISEEEDVQLEEEFVKYETQQTAYQAALQSATDILRLSIMNFL